MFRLGVSVGTKHQELQIAALADASELPQPASPLIDRNAITEQPHGALVSHALSNATCVRITSRIQGMVLKPTYGHDRRKHGI